MATLKKKPSYVSPSDTLRAMEKGDEVIIKNTQISLNNIRATADRINKDGSEYYFVMTTKGFKGQAIKITRIN